MSQSGTIINIINRLWRNLTSSEGDQDTPACPFASHSSSVFFRKCRKYIKFNQLVRTHTHAKFQAITPVRFHENARKAQIWPALLSERGTNRRKMNRLWPKRITFEGGQDTSVYQISGDSFHAFSRKWPETFNLTSFTQSLWHQKLTKSTYHDKNLTRTQNGLDILACKIPDRYSCTFLRKCLYITGSCPEPCGTHEWTAL